MEDHERLTVGPHIEREEVVVEPVELDFPIELLHKTRKEFTLSAQHLKPVTEF